VVASYYNTQHHIPEGNNLFSAPLILLGVFHKEPYNNPVFYTCAFACMTNQIKVQIGTAG
jgi:hypothetical protein